MRLSDEQRLDWLRLIRTDRIGPRTFRALLARFGDVRNALDALPDLARQSGRGALRVASRAQAEREIAALAGLGGRFVAQSEEDYPRTLLATDGAPPLLAVRGAAEALHRPTVAIVGSRSASASGAIVTERFAADLGQAGYVVVSGLARGIDTRAHRAALATGTVAVLAGGLDRTYPEENAPLLEAIIEAGGAAVSEMPVGWAPRGRDFPRRNRIVSGLSYGVVVVEAARRSGSLITARFALEQGREVFAAPGSLLDPRAEGTNDLIRNGATLCASADHVRIVLDPLIQRGPPTSWSLFDQTALAPLAEGARRAQALGDEIWDELEIGTARIAEPDSVLETDDGAGSERERILCVLGPVPIAVDELTRQLRIPAGLVHRVLVELELEGRIDRVGQTVALRVGR